MEHLTRHLVSQHFGRVVAQVDIDENRHGIVHLFLERPLHLAIEFTFSSRAVARIFGDAPSWKDMVVRLAVTQAHKLHLRQHISIGWRTEPLNLDGQPWVGDLLLAPFGGATQGLDPDARAVRPDGQPAQPWPGFSDRLKKALRDVRCNPGPRTLAREFNQRSATAQLSARTARHWLTGMATPSSNQLQVLASWLGVTADWLRHGDAAPVQLQLERRAVPEPAAPPPLPQEARERREHEKRGRRTDRLSASLVDQAIELQRAKGDHSAAAFLSKHAISHHIILRVLACAAFRRKPRCTNPITISAMTHDHSSAK
jgi:hypothetical protein